MDVKRALAKDAGTQMGMTGIKALVPLTAGRPSGAVL